MIAVKYLTLVGLLSIRSAKRAQEPKLNVHPFEPCPVIVKRLGIKVWPINMNVKNYFT